MKGPKKKKEGRKGRLTPRGKGPVLSLPAGERREGVHLSREGVSTPGPPSAVATPSEAPAPVGLEGSKPPEEGHPRREPPPSGGKPGAAVNGKQHSSGVADNLLTSQHPAPQAQGWTVTGLRRHTKALAGHRDQGEKRNV